MNFSDDRVIVSPGQIRSINECRESSPIPMDLILEIFSRLPAKSVARYRLLSKFWFKVISSQYFINLFVAKSSGRPQILFLLRNESSISFFSAPQPSKKSSDKLATTRLTHYPLSFGFNPLFTALINGLVCLSEHTETRMCTSDIYNPSTGEFLTLPTRSTYTNMRNVLGYDPTEKQIKVLSLHYYTLIGGDDNDYLDSQILTLGTKELSWRMIEGCKPHQLIDSEICINGVLYYRAFGHSFIKMIVCFDVRSETFKFMEMPETFGLKTFNMATLTNYNGKLGLLNHDESNIYITGENKSFELWILKDAEKYEWSKLVYVLPPLWKTVVGETVLSFVGMIGTNEIILCPSDLREPPSPCIFYYNIEKKTVRKLNIQGLEGLPRSLGVSMFLNREFI